MGPAWRSSQQPGTGICPHGSDSKVVVRSDDAGVERNQCAARTTGPARRHGGHCHLSGLKGFSVHDRSNALCRRRILVRLELANSAGISGVTTSTTRQRVVLARLYIMQAQSAIEWFPRTFRRNHSLARRACKSPSHFFRRIAANCRTCSVIAISTGNRSIELAP